MKKVEIKTEKCKSCSYCVMFCPQKILRLSKDINSRGFSYAEVNDPENKCRSCGLCAVMCPDVCIEVYKEDK